MNTKTEVLEAEQVNGAAMPALTGGTTLIEMAIKGNASIETLERLMALYEKERARHAEQEFRAALAKFQSLCPVIQKKKSAGSGNYAYKYTPMEHIRPIIQPIMEACGLSYAFDYEFNPGSVTTHFVLAHVGGHTQCTTVVLPTDGRMNETQKIGSTCTYGERYSMKGGLGLVFENEDDDGQTAHAGGSAPHAAPAMPQRKSAEADHARQQQDAAAEGPQISPDAPDGREGWQMVIIERVSEKATAKGGIGYSVKLNGNASNEKWPTSFDLNQGLMLNEAQRRLMPLWIRVERTDKGFVNIKDVAWPKPAGNATPSVASVSEPAKPVSDGWGVVTPLSVLQTPQKGGDAMTEVEFSTAKGVRWGWTELGMFGDRLAAAVKDAIAEKRTIRFRLEARKDVAGAPGISFEIMDFESQAEAPKDDIGF